MVEQHSISTTARRTTTKRPLITTGWSDFQRNRTVRFPMTVGTETNKHTTCLWGYNKKKEKEYPEKKSHTLVHIIGAVSSRLSR